jgi:hypothetical protein
MRDAEIDSLIINKEQHATRIRRIEKMLDTLDTPVWKRVLFRIDGWPAWYKLADKPQWRPWRRWYKS